VVTWLPGGRVAGALVFDGLDDLVQVAKSASWSASQSRYTVALCVKVETASDYKVAIGVGDWTNGPLKIYREAGEINGVGRVGLYDCHDGRETSLRPGHAIERHKR